jgi:hypothetical protein
VPGAALEELDSEIHHVAQRAAEDRIEARARLENFERRIAQLESTSASQNVMLARLEDSMRGARGFAAALILALVSALTAFFFRR